MQKQNLNKLDYFLLTLIIVVGLIFRLYKISTPLADFHSWRQADTASVARNFVRSGFDLLHPRYDDLANIQTGIYNPQGYRMVEFPIYNAIFAFIYKQIPALPIEIYGRLTSIFFSLTSIGIVYYLLKKEEGTAAAMFGSFVFAVFPFFVFFNRTVLPDTMAIALAFISIYFMYLSAKKEGLSGLLFLIFSAVSFSLGLLVKPTVIFYLLPIAYLFYRKFRFGFLTKLSFYLYTAILVIPIYLWRKYILAFPEGVPGSGWLLTFVNTPEGLQNIFFKPAFFRWIFYERLSNIILGGYMTAFFILGAIKKPKSLFLPLIGISALVYLFTFQGGNVQHEYYQILIFPALAIFVGLGFSFIVKNSKQLIPSLIVYPLIVAIVGFSFFFSFYRVRDYYGYSQDLVNIAQIVKTLTNPTDKIVTDTVGDTTLLYLADRRGFPAPTTDFPQLKKLGMSYFVTQKKEVIDSLKNDRKNKLEIVFESDKFAMFRL